ncbi:MAG: Gfo/Idh/MocA family oxidoreductase [Planctomycetes bacterium]|nr:Gfo/Idh/MocA family oxidoreductase [Planctomycetota bacterium]
MGRTWTIGIVQDTSRPMLGGHGLHVACRGLPGVEVAGLVDTRDQDIAARLAATGARRHFRTLEELLERARPDIVILCSRHPGDHLAQIRAAAERGVHVYCEKPMCADLIEADAIVALAERHGVRIAVAHPARHAAVFRALKDLLADGAIGRPLAAYGRGKCDHRGGGEDLVVLGTHILDLQAHLFGPPLHVQAEVWTGGRPSAPGETVATVEPIGPAAGDDIVATFAFAGGVHGHFSSHRGWAQPGNDGVIMGLTVLGDRGALSLRFNDRAHPPTTLRICRQPLPPEDGATYEDVPVPPCACPSASPLDLSLCGQPDVPQAPFFLEANRAALLDLMSAIETGCRPRCDADDARIAQEMIQGIYAAHLSGGRLRFPLAQREHPLLRSGPWPAERER